MLLRITVCLYSLDLQPKYSNIQCKITITCLAPFTYMIYNILWDLSILYSWCCHSTQFLLKNLTKWLELSFCYLLWKCIILHKPSIECPHSNSGEVHTMRWAWLQIEMGHQMLPTSITVYNVCYFHFNMVLHDDYVEDATAMKELLDCITFIT